MVISLFQKEEDIVENGKKITIIPAWKWLLEK